jgi:hypothetical protein
MSASTLFMRTFRRSLLNMTETEWNSGLFRLCHLFSKTSYWPICSSMAVCVHVAILTVWILQQKVSINKCIFQHIRFLYLVYSMKTCGTYNTAEAWCLCIIFTSFCNSAFSINSDYTHLTSCLNLNKLSTNYSQNRTWSTLHISCIIFSKILIYI